MAKTVGIGLQNFEEVIEEEKDVLMKKFIEKYKKVVDIVL